MIRTAGDSLAPGAIGRHLASAPVAFAVTGGERHTLLYANGAFERLLAEGEITIGAARSGHGVTAVDLKPVLDDVFRTGRAVCDLPLLGDDHASASWSCTVWPVSNAKARKLVIEVRDVELAESETAWHRNIAERLLLGALREHDDATTARAGSDRLRFLASASRELATSLNEDATRDVVRRLTLPRPGTWCIVDVVDSDGFVRRLDVEHPDPSKQELARLLNVTWPDANLGTVASADVVAVDTAARAVMVAAYGADNLRILNEIGFGAILVVPLMVHARVQGTMTFVSAKGEPPFTADEAALAVDLAARCAMALDNARLYREADSLRRVAEAASLSKSEFLSRMSHELHTPLNAIGGFADLMEMGIQGPITPDQRASLARIKANQKHLFRLITNVFDSAFGEQRREFVLVPIFMSDALEEVAGMLHGSAEQKGLTLVDAVASEAIAWADPLRLRQILLNVVMNAIKYTPRNGGTIMLSCSAAGDNVEAVIADAGPGIPPEELSRIFDPFVQLSAGATERQGGVGLGLAISRDLARSMRGDLTVTSTFGAGTRFTLTLPRAIGVRQID
jgi:signal transduction histidine kinase